MFVDEVSARESLVRMVRKVTPNGALRDDLLQEALVHLWATEISRPGQTRSWYLQSCKYHLLHYLAAGRSVDSAKRRNGQTRLEEDFEVSQEVIEDLDSGESVFGLVSVRDMMSLLSPLLSGQERSVLECFADGLRLREIGRRLKISHTMVIRHRRKIAALLKRLEKPRLPKPTGHVKGVFARRKPLHEKAVRKSVLTSAGLSLPELRVESAVLDAPELLSAENYLVSL